MRHHLPMPTVLTASLAVVVAAGAAATTTARQAAAVTAGAAATARPTRYVIAPLERLTCAQGVGPVPKM